MSPIKESSFFKKKSFYVFLTGLLPIVIIGSAIAYKKLSRSKLTASRNEDGKHVASIEDSEESPVNKTLPKY